MQKELRELGLTKNESSVYIALLQSGSTSAGEVIKKTKLHRNIVYENLGKLVEKGLASFVIVGKIKYFEASSSSELKIFVDKQKQEALKKEKIVKSILPKINSLRKVSEIKQEATIFKGKKGLKTVLEETTLSKSELLIFGTGWGLKQTLKRYNDFWYKKLRKNKVKVRMLLPESKKGKYSSNIKVKYLADKKIIPSTIAIYEDNVLNILWEEETAVVIKSNKVAESYKNYFDIFWNLAKK